MTRIGLFIIASLALGYADPAVQAEQKAEPVYQDKPLSAWVKLLDSPDQAKRLQAANAIGKLVTQSQAGVRSLQAALRGKDLPTREAAWRALLSVGRPAVPVFTRALWDRDQGTRYMAVLAMARLGYRAKPAVPSLLALLEEKHPVFRAAVIQALVQIGSREAMPALTELLQDKNIETRLLAAGGLADLGAEASLLIPVLVEALKEKEDRQRIRAATYLRNLGPEARPALAEIIKSLEDGNREVQLRAIETLGQLGPAAREAIPRLKTILQVNKTATALEAADALWRIQRSADDVVPLIKKWHQANKHEDVLAARLLWTMKRDPVAATMLGRVIEQKRPEAALAVEALWKMGPAARAALPALKPLFSHKNPGLRQTAITIVGRIGKPGKVYLDELDKLSRDKDGLIRFCAARARWQILSNRASLIQLAAFLGDKDPDLRQGAANSLLEIGRPAKDVLAQLLNNLNDKDSMVRLVTADAVWVIAKHEKAVPVILQCLDDSDFEVRSQATLIVSLRLQQHARRVVPVLIQLLWDDNLMIRSNAAEALGRMAAAAQEAIPALVVALRAPGQEDQVYTSSAEALGLMGAAAKPAVPVLLKRLKHPDAYVRVNAAKALWLIEENRAAIPVAEKGLQNRRLRVRIYAAEILWFMNKHPQSLPLLIDVVKDDLRRSENERYMAARALGRIGPPAGQALPALRRLLDEVDPYLRETAGAAIKRIESTPRSEK